MHDRCLLYYITDRTAFGVDEATRRESLLEKITEAALAGVDYIQLRERDLSTRELELLARKSVALLNDLRAENRELKTALLINSRTDIAISVGADGVHLRSDDISPREVTTIWTKRSPIVGVSCHSPEEVSRAAENDATLAVFAPVFEKNYAPRTPPRGLAQLSEACTAKIPVLALGGITLENARSCLDAGAAGIAAIRLFQENSIAGIVAALPQFGSRYGSEMISQHQP